MKIKKLAMTLGMAAIAGHASAQYEQFWGTVDFTDTDARYKVAYIGDANHGYASPEDAVKSNIFDYNMQRQNGDNEQMYADWKWLITNAPIASNTIYAHGAPMLYKMITTETDAAKKKQLFDDLMGLYDTRLKYLKYLNASVPEGKKGRTTEGDVLIAKADYFYFAGYGVSPDYSYEHIYKMYADAMKLINEEGGREVKGAYIRNFFDISTKLYNAANDYYREQYLKDYLESKEVCEKMLQLAKEETDPDKAQKIVDQYDQPLSFIEATFANSGAANREQLVALFTPKVEENKENLAYLRSVMAVLSSNDCDDTDVYYAAAQYAYNIEPTYESAIGMAQYAKKDNKLQEMLGYYAKAIELCKTDGTRGNICLNIANSLIKGKQYTGALMYLDNAIEYNAELAGKAYLQKAIVHTALGQYDQALNFCDQAGAADITVSGSAGRLADKVRSAQANSAAAAKAKAAYDAYIAKQKEEEAFWSKKK